jgi:hypothetical protein
VVDAPFEAPEPATVTFAWLIAPLSPGLLIRTVMTTFVGCCCVAEAADSAAC